MYTHAVQQGHIMECHGGDNDVFDDAAWRHFGNQIVCLCKCWGWLAAYWSCWVCLSGGLFNPEMDNRMRLSCHATPRILCGVAIMVSLVPDSQYVISDIMRGWLLRLA